MKKLFVLIIITVLLFCTYYFRLNQYLNLSYIKEHLDQFLIQYEQNKGLFIVIYTIVYILTTALSIPGATVLTLVGGAIFGLGLGTLIISFASTIGATLSFLAARYLLSEIVMNKFAATMQTVNEGIAKDGPFYLFSLRLIPIFPFFLINLVMGLTNMSVFTYFWVSQIGMLAGTLAYVNAGLQLSKISSLSDVMSFSLIASFSILGILPIMAKKIIGMIKAKKVYKGYKRPKKYDYNLVAIGGGAAGLVSVYIGAAVKAKTALIEKNKMGGDCLNTGCVPSKALLRSAHLLYEAKTSGQFGIKSMTADFSFEDIMNRVQSIIKKIEPHDSIKRYSSLGVDCISGHAKIVSPWEVEIDGKKITTKNIVIACGAKPFIPHIKCIENIGILTSESVWTLKKCPDKLLVLGAGPIGCELAQAFSRLGSQVTIVEMKDSILPIEDRDSTAIIKNQFEKENINLLLEHKAMEFVKGQNGIHKLICEHKGSQVKIEFDQVLICVGRKARTEGYGLKELNVPLRKNGTIEVNEFLQTNYPNIFACGDVTGPFQFTHTAAHQAWFCAVNGLFGSFKKFKVDYSVIPWCTYTDPEIATVGLTEKEAERKNISYELTKYEINDLDRAITDSQDRGFVKVLTVPGKDKILGATIVGTQAGNLIIEFVIAMKHGYGLNKILSTIHIYPTMAEANKYAAGQWKKNQDNTNILKYLEKFFKYIRS